MLFTNRITYNPEASSKQENMTINGVELLTVDERKSKPFTGHLGKAVVRILTAAAVVSILVIAFLIVTGMSTWLSDRPLITLAGLIVTLALVEAGIQKTFNDA